MISETQLQLILGNEDQKNVICKSLELRPKIIAGFIAELANIPDKYSEGFILIGVSEDDGNTIIGLNSRFKLKEVVRRALEYLVFKPDIEEDLVVIQSKNVYVITVKRSDHFIAVGNDIITRNESLIDGIIKACIKVQRSDGFKDKSEDERTDMIRDLLQYHEEMSEEKKYKISGQERQGTTKAGKASGEVDLLINDMEGITVSVIEALNLSSLNRVYLSQHIDKVYNYDTLGKEINFLISYVKIKDFSSFWSKYKNFIMDYDYPHQVIDFDERIVQDHDYSDLRYISSILNRHGKITVLFQIIVKIIE